MQFPPVPPEVKSIAHFLKVAEEHEERNIVIAYWARMYACTRSMQLMQGKKNPAVTNLLIALMDWMEVTKKANSTNEGITNETAACAMIENYALQLFAHGDAQDRAEIFNKNTIKAFYTAGILMDILEQFGPLSEDIQSKRKYAKWKAAYIHNCLKVGDIPIPGAPGEQLNNVVHRADLEDNVANNTGDKPPENTAGFTDPSDIGAPFMPPQPPTITPQPSVSPPTPSSPYVPPPASPYQAPPSATPTSGSSINLSPQKVKRAQKLCKFAESALDYEDFKTAVDNLQKALKLIQTGEED